MVFASASFLFLFFPIVFIGYYCVPKKTRNLWLFLASVIFYAWSGVAYALLVLFSVTINYWLGLYINNANGSARKKYLIIAILFNLSLLGFFKYFNFVCNNVGQVLNFLDITFEIKVPQIPLPIGISFFTFQIMSYIIDLYRGEIQVQNKWINLGLYIMLFPQLIAGPIVRYIDVEKEINERVVTFRGVEQGFKRFILGLSKKVLIANAMGMWADAAFNMDPSGLSTLMAWLGIFGYTMQIFFDFSAYSDMAIGLGMMFGFHFLENFNYPYIANSVQEFWRRWHMSLSSWFRDYLYIPLGGNRKGKRRTYINNIIVFFSTGLWHGASWNFVFWGLYHGFFLIAERIGLKNILKYFPVWCRHIYTMLVVGIGWVFFRAENFGTAIRYLGTMFKYRSTGDIFFYYQLENWNILIACLAIILSTPIVPKLKSYISSDSLVYIVFSNAFYVFLFGISIMFIAGSSFNPFIYFRF